MCRVQTGVATAMVLCHRYFACKSMRQNDCFVRAPKIPSSCRTLHRAKSCESTHPLKLFMHCAEQCAKPDSVWAGDSMCMPVSGRQDRGDAQGPDRHPESREQRPICQPTQGARDCHGIQISFASSNMPQPFIQRPICHNLVQFVCMQQYRHPSISIPGKTARRMRDEQIPPEGQNHPLDESSDGCDL